MLDKEKKGPTDMARGPRQGKGLLSFSGTSFILKRCFKNACDYSFPAALGILLLYLTLCSLFIEYVEALLNRKHGEGVEANCDTKLIV